MNNNKQDKRREITIEILKTVAITGSLLVAMVIAPKAAGALAKLIESFENSGNQQWRSRYKYNAQRAIKNMEKRGLIVTESSGEKMRIKITQAGKRFLNHHNIIHLKITKPNNWDGLWRVVVFDISEKDREIRNTIRGWLKRLGFARLQKSVWVIPWPCRKEFELLAAEYKLGTQAILLESKTIARESSLKRIFNITT